MTDYASLEDKYQLPRGILAATSRVESNGNPNAVSPQGARGEFQLMPATAAAISGATDAEKAAKLWAENLRASKGDVDRAAMMYHGGPNTKIWGPKTQAYPGKLAAALPKQDAPNAFLAHVGGGGENANAPEDNAFLAHVSGNPAQVEAPTVAPAHPVQPMGVLPRFGFGARKGGADAIDGPAQLLEHGATAIGNVFGAQNIGPRMSHALGMPSADEVAASRAKAYADNLKGNEPGAAGIAGEVIGNAIPTAATALMTGGGSMPMTATRMGATGAGAGLMQPVADAADYWTDKAKDAAAGAVGGVVGGKLVNGVSRVISPKVSELVKVLQAHGVPLTIGQITGAGGGVIGKGIRTVEDAARSVPFLGNAITSAQNRSLEGLNRAAVGRALTPIGDKLPDNVATGHEAVAYAQKKIGAAYDAITPKLSAKADASFATNLGKILTMAQSPSAMSPGMSKRLESVIRDDVLRRFSSGGAVTGNAFRELESKLGNTAKSYASSPDPDHRQFGAALLQIQEELRGLAVRVNPSVAGELKKIHSAFRNLATVENAASGGADGIFTPAKLAQVVRGADTSARKRATAGGRANMQDLSNAARAVLPSTVPDSGTATRGMVGATIALGANAAGAGIPVAAGTAGATALYSKQGQKLAEALLTKRPKGAEALAKAVRAGMPLAVAGGSRGAVNAQ